MGLSFFEIQKSRHIQFLYFHFKHRCARSVTSAKISSTLKVVDYPHTHNHNYHYFSAADYLRLQPFSLINGFIFRENTPISKIVV